VGLREELACLLERRGEDIGAKTRVRGRDRHGRTSTSRGIPRRCRWPSVPSASRGR